eukprot:c5575_g1_i1.p1 GENE.c5575_g1_i1~~c5575_g1_i1.p1  ORF type:complete len:423 (-),score=87.17 c5575_g1_i1:98-1366(-)
MDNGATNLPLLLVIPPAAPSIGLGVTHYPLQTSASLNDITDLIESQLYRAVFTVSENNFDELCAKKSSARKRVVCVLVHSSQTQNIQSALAELSRCDVTGKADVRFGLISQSLAHTLSVRLGVPSSWSVVMIEMASHKFSVFESPISDMSDWVCEQFPSKMRISTKPIRLVDPTFNIFSWIFWLISFVFRNIIWIATVVIGISYYAPDAVTVVKQKVSDTFERVKREWTSKTTANTKSKNQHSGSSSNRESKPENSGSSSKTSSGSTSRPASAAEHSEREKPKSNPLRAAHWQPTTVFTLLEDLAAKSQVSVAFVFDIQDSRTVERLSNLAQFHASSRLAFYWLPLHSILQDPERYEPLTRLCHNSKKLTSDRKPRVVAFRKQKFANFPVAIDDDMTEGTFAEWIDRLTDGSVGVWEVIAEQ